jgi:hypothetical protein
LTRKPADAPVEETPGDPAALLAFASEETAGSGRRASPGPRISARAGRTGSSVIVAAAVGIIAVIGVGAAARIRGRAVLSSGGGSQGKVVVNTRPSGAEIDIDGRPLGSTPLSVTLEAGTHAMRVRRAGVERLVPLNVAPGAELTQYLELPESPPPVARSGRIAVTTEPPGARVSIDGRFYGTSPASIEGVSPTEHTIAVAGAAGSGERVVRVEAGGTTSLVFSLAKSAGSTAGWLTVFAPFSVQVLERNEIVGSSETPRIMVPSGRHEFALVNDPLGYRENRRVDVPAAKTVTLRVQPPRASLSVNARPWADISIDGREAGQTPIANYVIAIGRHDVTFRHPDLGERHQAVVVTVKGPNRIAVDLNK